MGRKFFCDIGVAFLALFCLSVRPPLRFGCSISAAYVDFFAQNFTGARHLNFQLQGAERGEVGLASNSVTIGHLNSAIFLFVTDTHTHTHTYTHMWVSSNVKIMKAIRTKKIEICSHFFQRANGMKRDFSKLTGIEKRENVIKMTLVTNEAGLIMANI